MSSQMASATKTAASAPPMSAPVRRGLLQRQCACGGAAGPSGECAACRRKRLAGGGVLQAKLRVNQPGDRFEQEADRVAEQVMRMPGPALQRQADEEEEEELLQAKPRSARSFGEISVFPDRSPQPVQPRSAVGPRKWEEASNGEKSLVPRGMELPVSLRKGLEQLSGVDLSGVRVHRNSSKPAQLNALAYTQGRDIYVAPGQEKYLPHEGWHVVQQLQGRVRPTGYLKGVPVNDDAALEQEADRLGEKAARIHVRSSDSKSSGSSNNPGQGISTIRKTVTRKSNAVLGLPGSQRIEIVQGVAGSPSAQFQADEEREDPEKRREYESLQPEGGAGSRTVPAQPPKPVGLEREEEDLSQLKSNDVLQRARCSPANTALGRNALAFAERTRESWRSHVTYRAWVDNQNDHLTIRMYVFAKVYYGLWVSWEHLNFSATVDLTCRSTDDKCEISANERGGSVWDLTDSPASGAIAVQTDRRAGGTQMALIVRVGGAVGASSSVSAGVGSASVGVSFPDASISHKMSMGTYIYTCLS